MARNSKENPRMSLQQKAVLIEFLETHPNLVTGQLCKGFSAEDKSRLWTEITMILNELGVSKGVSEWKGSWKDLKKTVKNKAAKVRETQKLQGTTRVTPLTDLEERVIILISNNPTNGAPSYTHHTQDNVSFRNGFENAVAVATQNRESEGTQSHDEFSQEGIPFHLAPEVQMYPQVLEQPNTEDIPEAHDHAQMHSAHSAISHLDPRYKVQVPPIIYPRKRGSEDDEDGDHLPTNVGIAMTMLQEQGQSMSRLTAVLERQAIVQEEILALKKQRLSLQAVKEEEKLALMKQKMETEHRKAAALEQIAITGLSFLKSSQSIHVDKSKPVLY